jgi:hypothetical protein
VPWTYSNFQCSIPVPHALDARDGSLLETDGDTKLYLIEPDPAGFKPLASAELLESGNNWAPIALVDGRLLIRDQKQMKCVQAAQSAR